MTRGELSDLIAEHLFPRMGLLQRSAIVAAINLAPDDAFEAIGPLWDEGQRAMQEGGAEGLRAFLERQGAPKELIDLVTSYAEDAAADPH